MATMILTLTIPDGEAAHDAAAELLPAIVDAVQDSLDTREALRGSVASATYPGSGGEWTITAYSRQFSP